MYHIIDFYFCIIFMFFVCFLMNMCIIHMLEPQLLAVGSVIPSMKSQNITQNAYSQCFSYFGGKLTNNLPLYFTLTSSVYQGPLVALILLMVESKQVHSWPKCSANGP